MKPIVARKISYLLTTACLCLCMPLLICSQQHALETNILDSRKGLSNSSVNFLFQDSDNLLWVATWDGLNLYDGSSFHVFNYNVAKKDVPSIGNNVIEQVTEDANNNIWISTVEGISKFNKSTNRFSNFFYSQTTGRPFAEKQYRLLTDNRKQLYCFSPAKGFIRYNPASDIFDPVDINVRRSEINEIRFDEDGRLWILTQTGKIKILSSKNNRFFQLNSQHFDAYQFKQLFSAGNDIFMVDHENYLHLVNSGSLVPERKTLLPARIRSICLYKEHYFIALAGEGFMVLDKHFGPSEFLNDELNFLRTTQINTIVTTRDQTLWCGTDGSGIIQVGEPRSKFQTITNQSLGFLNNKQTRSFLETGNELWVGTKGNGILIFDKPNDPMQWIHKRSITTPELDNNAVYCLLKSSNDIILIGSDGPGFSLYDIRSKKIYNWASFRKNGSVPHFGSVYSFWEDKDGSIWIGTSGYGLIHIKLSRSINGFNIDFAEQFRYTGKDNGPANDIIYNIIADGRSNLLLACRYGGLSVFDPRTRHFNNSIKAFTYAGGLTHNDILSLCRDSKHNIWIGTSFGLNKVKEEDLYKPEPQFRQFSVNNGLTSNTIHGIVEDNSGFIWVTTNKGIARFHSEKDEIVKYSDRDGLQSNEFSDGAIWKNTEGVLYFGGIYGFSYCMPDQIRITGTQPNLLISDFKLGKSADQPNGFWILPVNKKIHPPEYSTTKTDNFFDLKLKAIDFANAEKCEYAYKLDGYDQLWHYSGNNGSISYANLPPGIYSLKVKWSNGDSKWTDEIKALDITVQQHFLLTFPAFLLYYLLLVTGGYVYYTNRKHKLQMRRQLALEQQLRAKEEQLHGEKINFFTNIAHELQTPVTLMMGSLERHEFNKGEKENKPFLALVKQQAARLTYLVQQILEFRKAEDGYLRKELNTVHITNLLSNIAFLFYSNKDQKKFRFDIVIEENLAGITDKDKLEKIVYNLLSNAFKHSPAGEQIAFTAARREDNLLIEVANSGVDLSEQETERLFDKFFTQSNVTQGGFSTGIGLTFTRQLVSVLGGSIDAECVGGRIIFTVIVPVQFENIKERMAPAHEVPSQLLQSIIENNIAIPEIPAANNKQSLLEDVSTEIKPAVLVVDDDADIRFLLRDILQPAYIVYEAVNGKDGIEWLSKHKADIIISDVMMPGMSGLDFCEVIKNAPDTCHIPVVLLSARGSIDHQTEGYEAGADAYIPKPFHVQHLIVRMQKLLERRKLLQLQLENNVFKVEGEAGVHDDDKQFLAGLVKYVEENIDDTELSASHLERHCLLSKMQLYRKLKILSGMSPGEFIRHVRLQKAAYLLQSSNLSVAEIFYQTGFNNQSYFFREFKKYYHCSPGEYRELRRLKL